MIAAGVPPAFVAGSLTGQAFIRDGHNELSTDDIAHVLGSPPHSYATLGRRPPRRLRPRRRRRHVRAEQTGRVRCVAAHRTPRLSSW
ncbi:hypothetical protein ACTWPB_00545 [Nocardia sp. IBHARD005]|uniref:hypothetical protein n=1 Tax=Nocardia sp. IBHARD005 TaxID=3457765 RepID=UPI0040585C43